MNFKNIILSLVAVSLPHFCNSQLYSYEWTNSFGTNAIQGDFGLNITVDNSNNIISTGYFSGTVDFDPGTGVFNLTSNGSRDIYVQKLDSDGNLLWAASFGGITLDEYADVTINLDGSILMTGFYKDSVDFDPGPGTEFLYNGIYNTIFILKLDASGNFVWVKEIASTSQHNFSDDIQIDGLGNIIITGGFRDTTDFDPGLSSFELISEGDYDAFVLKLDEDGNFQWVQTVGGSYGDVGVALGIDGMNNIYVGGYFFSTVDFDPGVGTNIHTAPAGLSDSFILKFDQTGNYQWANTFGDIKEDRIEDLTVDDDGNIYACGFFGVTVDFDPSLISQSATSNGLLDVFILSWSPSGNFEWVKTFGGSGADRGTALVIDSDGIYLTACLEGYSQPQIDIDPGPGTAFSYTIGQGDFIVEKLNLQGDFEWGFTIGGPTYDWVSGIELDSEANILITGFYRDSVDFDPTSGVDMHFSVGDKDAFISKFGQIGFTQLMETSPLSNFVVYPNPALNEIYISSTSDYMSDTLKIYSVSGHLVQIEKLTNLTSEQIDISSLPSGIYFLEINERRMRLVKL